MELELITPAINMIIDGKVITEVPDDLFIPPDALEVLLDSFSGPLDLLLYLIRKQNINILDIPIMSITQQYLHYISLMEHRRMELAADYLLMAAMLAEIKSKMLLPIPANSVEDEDGEDPRMTLVRKLQAYEQIKTAAEHFDMMPRVERDHYILHINTPKLPNLNHHPDVQLTDLIQAMQGIIKKEAQFSHHRINREHLSVHERMNSVLFLLQKETIIEFKKLFLAEEGRLGVVVSLLAVLELARQSLLVITQSQAFAPIYLQAA